jgi:hypothetical protein
MSRRAQLPDGQILEFPDNTPDAVMDRVVKSHISGQAPAPEAPKDNSALGGFIGGVMKPLDNLTSAAMNIPGLSALDQVGQAMGLPSAQQATAHNDQLRQNNTRTGYQTLGNIVGTLPTMMLPGGTLVQGGASGALLTDKKTPAGVAIDSTIGAVGSKLVGAAANGLAWAAKPVVSKTAQVLHDAGIDLTLGQMARGSKSLGSQMIAGIEDRAAGLPLIGDVVKAARARGTEQLNKKLASDALAQIGEKLPTKISAGHELVDLVQDKLSEKYQQVVPNLVGRIDQQFGQDLAAAKAVTNILPRDKQRQFKAILDNVFTNRMDPGGRSISGQALKDAESRLGKLARDYGKSTDTDQRILSEAITEAQRALRSMAARSDKSGVILQNINKGYAKFKLIQAAANLDNVVYPNSLLRQANKTGFNQELARAAFEMLPNKIPDSGTAGRVMAGQMLLGGGGGAALGAFSTPAAAVPLAASALYTKPGMTALNKFVFRNTGAGSAAAAKAIKQAAKLAPVVIPPLLRAR